MPLVLADRVRETTTTTGTGTISLAGPVSGFQGFSTAIGNANTTYYTIVDAATGAWEVGLGTYTSAGNTLARTTVLSSSNSDALVPFASGVKDVFVTQPAERAVYVLGAGTGLAAGAAAFTANGVPYADSTSTLATGANLTYAEGGSNQLTVTSASASYFTSTVGANTSYFGTNGTGTYVGSGTNVPVVFYQNNAEGMRLTSTGLGIGTTSPARQLVVYTPSSSSATIQLADSVSGVGAAAGSIIQQSFADQSLVIRNYAAAGYIRFDTTGASEKMRLDSSGNLGLGVTPSAWSLPGLVALQVKNGSLYGYQNEFGAQANTYYNAGWKYITTAPASQYTQTAGQHIWYNAPSGTAGNAISFTQAMTLDASGNLAIGLTSASARLHLGGSANNEIRVDTTASGYLQLGQFTNGAFIGTSSTNPTAGILRFGTGGSEQMRLDTSGNLSMAAAGAITSSRINPRTSTTASTATLTPDIQAADQYNLTAQAAALAINAPTGTPVDGNKLLFRILDNGSAQTITWDGTYTAIGVTLPTATTANKMTYVGCIYNSTNTRWDVIAVTTQA